MTKNVTVKGINIKINEEKYISLTDIARKKNPEDPRFVVKNWLRKRSTIEFLGIWEAIHNHNFNRVEFDSFRMKAGLNAFVLNPKRWIENTNAIGMHTKQGRYNSGTYAHEDIALEFASWISPEFKLYFIKEFRRLKEIENNNLELDWNVKRILTKINYKIHTHAIKKYLIPRLLNKEEINRVCEREADVLNLALFGKTATQNKHLREEANVAQLVCLANLENVNALFIEEGLSQSKRLERLNKIAIDQMKLLVQDSSVKQLEK